MGKEENTHYHPSHAVPGPKSLALMIKAGSEEKREIRTVERGLSPPESHRRHTAFVVINHQRNPKRKQSSSSIISEIAENTGCRENGYSSDNAGSANIRIILFRVQWKHR